MRVFNLREAAIRDRCLAHIAAITPDEKMAVLVAPEKRIRTEEQNALLWAEYEPWAAATGFSKEQLHEYCKRRFLGVQIAEVYGERIEVVRSSTKLYTDQFSDFIEAIRQVKSEHGIE
jgi:hypothetical protein